MNKKLLFKLLCLALACVLLLPLVMACGEDNNGDTEEPEEETVVVADFMEKYADVDGVFVSGYSLSQVFYEEAISQGKKIPDDLQIVSYDGIFKQWGISNITSVEQPIEEMARQVVRLLIKKIHNEETCTRTVLKTKFVLGTTTK